MNQNNSNIANEFVHTFYAVRADEKKFFKGFSVEQKSPIFVDSPLKAKLFSNRFDVSLRPNETLVQIDINLESGKIDVSEPFRPKRRPSTKNTQVNKNE